MSDLHTFNAGRKSWKMYAKELTSVSGDDLTITPHDGQNLILEVSGNKDMIFKKGDVSYNLIISHATSTSLYVGASSGISSTGDANTFLGINSGYANTSGLGNTFIGSGSAYNNDSGSSNTFLGAYSGHSSTGSQNTFLGHNSGYNNIADYNVFIGYYAGFNNTIGFLNTFIGSNCGKLNVNGGYNAFFGINSGYNNKANYNTFIGINSGYNNESGEGNTFLGSHSGHWSTGSQNTFLGTNSGWNNTANTNTFVGYSSGNANTSGNSNTFIGWKSGMSNKLGIENTIIGHAAGYNNTANYNTFVGFNSGTYNTTGGWNTFLGLQSGLNNGSGSNNTFIGLNSGYYSTGSSNNTFLGRDAGFHNRDGSNNIAIGYNAQFKQDPGGTLGVHNTSNNEIVIGTSAVGNGSNTITLGNTSSTQLYLPGLQAGAATSDVLTFDGTKIALATSGSSDDRIKTHEEIISSETYINYIKQIVPKKYKKYGFILTQEEEAILEAGGDPFKEKKTGDVTHDSKYIPRSEIGVIAQDIYEISGLQDFVKKGDEDIIWAVDYTSINTITLGAVKELIDKIEKLEAEVKILKSK